MPTGIGGGGGESRPRSARRHPQVSGPLLGNRRLGTQKSRATSLGSNCRLFRSQHRIRADTKKVKFIPSELVLPRAVLDSDSIHCSLPSLHFPSGLLTFCARPALQYILQPSVHTMSWLSKLSPIPAFPAYTGPHQVGTVDVEIPSADLRPVALKSPPGACPTTAFRLFYPCDEAENHARPVRWIPQPQKTVIASMARFLGSSSWMAEIYK